MGDLRKVLKNINTKYITIDFENGKRSVVSNINYKAQKIDKEIYEQNKIILTEFGKVWTNV